MSFGSVGLGLTTKRMSVATTQDKKTGKAIAFFLTLSVLILFANCFAPAAVENIRHKITDRTMGVTAIINTPMIYVEEKIAALQMIIDVRNNNAQLLAENQRLLEWYQQANRLEAENIALRDLLKMKDDDALEFQSGQILADAETQYSHTILVKLGKNDGIEKGQGVLTYEGLIGRVIETGENTSRVLLLSDMNSRIPVMVEGSKDRAILAGQNNGDPILDHLPENTVLSAGQKIITSGHGGVFPFGVPVGETYKDDNGNIVVRPYANSGRSSHVQVVNYGIPAGSARRSVASGATGVLR